MSEQAIFDQVKGRELKRWQKAVNDAIEEQLTQKFQDVEDYDEYQRFVGVCNQVRANLRWIDQVAERLGPLFEEDRGRKRWEIFLTGLRKLNRQLPDSYFLRFVLPMYRLEDLAEKWVAYGGEWLEFVHSAHRSLRHADRYLEHLESGQAIARSYNNENEDLPRLYASLKTWETAEDFQEFFSALEDFLNHGVEVFISGPIQLYLMLRRDTFLLIFKALTVERLGEIERDDDRYAEIMSLHDFVYGLVEGSETFPAQREIVKQAVENYVEDLRQEHEELRQQVPREELRHRFVERFESGALFRESRY